MPFELWVATGVAVVAILGWISLLSSIGTAEAATSAGFSFRNLLRRTEFVRWEELRGPGDRFETHIPRIILRRANASFFRLARSYSILTSSTPQHVLAMFETRYSIRRSRLERYFE
jgi:hypothetical protein